MCVSSRVSARGGERAGRGVSARGARRGRSAERVLRGSRRLVGLSPLEREAGDVRRAGKGRPGAQGRDWRARTALGVTRLQV